MKELVEMHYEKIMEKLAALKKAQDDLNAYQMAFEAGLQEKLGISKDQKQVHLVELLKKALDAAK